MYTSTSLVANLLFKYNVSTKSARYLPTIHRYKINILCSRIVRESVVATRLQFSSTMCDSLMFHFTLT